MSAAYALAYPSTKFEPIGLVDLSSKAERERLSASALKGFFNLVSKWHIKDEDARELLGGVSNSAFYEWKKNPQRCGSNHADLFSDRHLQSPAHPLWRQARG